MKTSGKQPQSVAQFFSHHFWVLYFLSILLLILVSFHRLVGMLPSPVVIDGQKTGNANIHRFGRPGAQYGVTLISAPIIEFDYKGQSYTIEGGWEESHDHEPVSVIMPDGDPESARELSVFGLLDFKGTSWAYIAWLFLAGGIYALASEDDHFTVGNFRIRRLKLPAFAGLAAVCITVPLWPYMDLILFGRTVQGTITDEERYTHQHYQRIISYPVGDGVIRNGIEGVPDDETLIGTHLPVRYLPFYPQRAILYRLPGMYDNNYAALMGIAMVFIFAWYMASRNMEENSIVTNE